MTEESQTSLIIRSPRADEIPETVTVFLETLGDLRKRFGIPNDPPEDRAHWERGYDHVLKTGIFLVAEIDGKIQAICCGFTRGTIWFLTGFWVMPEFQSKRIGGRLIREVWEKAEAGGATVFFTWASIDARAMGTYMKLGLLPGYQILTFGGEVTSLPDASMKAEVETTKSADLLAGIDRNVIACDKTIDHQFWLKYAGHEARVVHVDGAPVGYFYLFDGLVAPACWVDNKYSDVVLHHALKESVAQHPGSRGRLSIPGINHAAIRYSLGAGLKILRFSHFLTSAEFGHLDQYIPSGPTLF